MYFNFLYVLHERGIILTCLYIYVINISILLTHSPVLQLCLSPPITLPVPILDIFTLVLAVKSNFTNQYLLILTLGLTNNIFIMYELLCSGTNCTVYLD